MNYGVGGTRQTQRRIESWDNLDGNCESREPVPSSPRASTWTEPKKATMAVEKLPRTTQSLTLTYDEVAAPLPQESRESEHRGLQDGSLH